MSLDATGSNPVSATIKAVRIVFDMSAARAVTAGKPDAKIAAQHTTAATTAAHRCARRGNDTLIVSGLLAGGVAPLDVDVVVQPRMLLVHRVLET